MSEPPGRDPVSSFNSVRLLISLQGKIFHIFQKLHETVLGKFISFAGFCFTARIIANSFSPSAATLMQYSLLYFIFVFQLLFVPYLIKQESGCQTAEKYPTTSFVFILSHCVFKPTKTSKFTLSPTKLQVTYCCIVIHKRKAEQFHPQEGSLFMQYAVDVYF